MVAKPGGAGKVADYAVVNGLQQGIGQVFADDHIRRVIRWIGKVDAMKKLAGVLT